MPNKPKQFVPLPPPRPVLTCGCIDPSNIVCLSGRHQVSLHLSGILDGCACPCHVVRNGVSISHNLWRPIVIEHAVAHGWRPGPSEVK
ncbi:MAG TPA: hypothetical protein VII61_09805 [Ktedonobacteraceae bacterium]